MDAVLEEMAEEADLASTMLGRCADFAARLAGRAIEQYRLDWLWTGDDVAGKESLIVSPAMWRRLIRPHLQRVIDAGRRAGLPVAYHCCGSLRPIIGDLIEMGVAVLNPVQAGCPGMEPESLKREFGRSLTFMGGVDTVDLLPHARAADVRRATARLIDIMTADGGGYILAASHTVPPETPGENIFAMLAAAGISREEVFDHAADLRKKR